MVPVATYIQVAAQAMSSRYEVELYLPRITVLSDGLYICSQLRLRRCC